MNELATVLNGKKVGVVEQDEVGKLTFTYEDTWRDAPDSFPISLSMPLGRKTHTEPSVRAFLEGLLPDNRQILENWGRTFHVSPRNPFALLSQIGEDCPGAVQFIVPDRLDSVLNSSGTVEWISKNDIVEILTDLVDRHGTGRPAGSEGQFSLAGAQPKTALLLDGDRWGIPSGRIPTTHILKPAGQSSFGDFEINEHFCLQLASDLGLSVPNSWVEMFDQHPTIVIERYDRGRDTSGNLSRIHQEDMCQALAIPPWTKYENEGGPGIPDIVELLIRHSNDPETDVGTFLDAMVLNWVIQGSDAHAKNFSIVIGPGSVRLAPLYDIVSVLPYADQIPFRKVKMAMRIDKEYLVWKIRRRHWEGLAERCNLDLRPLLERVSELTAAIPDAARVAADKLLGEGLAANAVRHLEKMTTERSRECLEALKKST